MSRSEATLASALDGATPGFEDLVRGLFGAADSRAVGAEVDQWCRTHLGAAVAAAPWAAASSGLVVAVDLTDGRRLVVKVRPRADRPRLEESRSVQAVLAADGFPAPTPIGPLVEVGTAGVAGAEARVEGGRPVVGASPPGRGLLARLLHRLIGRATALAPPGLTLHEPWGIALPTGQLWPDPPHDPGFDLRGTTAGAEWIDERATVLRARMVAGSKGRPRVIGHVDWRGEHVLVDPTGAVVAVYDWDALVRSPEPVIVGQAAAAFAAEMVPGGAGLPDVAEARAFVADYEATAGRAFDDQERDLVDAAHGYVVAYGARCEHSDQRTGRRDPAPDRWRHLLRERERSTLS